MATSEDSIVVKELKGVIEQRVALSYALTIPNDENGNAKERLDAVDYERARVIVATFLAAARAEGAEQMREKIVQGSERLLEGTDVETSEYFGIAYGVHEDNVLANSEVFIVPASLLSPAPKETP